MTTALLILLAWLPTAIAVAWLFGEAIHQNRCPDDHEP
jgi:hypothetical protein